MLKKSLCISTMLFALTACTTAQTNTTTHPTTNNYAQKIVGQWQCETIISTDPLITLTSEDDIRNDGSWHSTNLITLNVDDNLAYRFSLKGHDTWHVVGNKIYVKHMQVSDVKEIPSNNQTERITLKLFEKSTPEIVTLKQELLAEMSKIDDDEIKGKIINLNDTNLKMVYGDDDTTSMCKRIK